MNGLVHTVRIDYLYIVKYGWIIRKGGGGGGGVKSFRIGIVFAFATTPPPPPPITFLKVHPLSDIV